MAKQSRTGWYADARGRQWLCVEREGGMSCHSRSGLFTAADHPTFDKWGWVQVSADELARAALQPPQAKGAE